MRTLMTLTMMLLSAAVLCEGAAGEDKLPASVRITREPDAATLLPSDDCFKVTCKVIGKTIAFTLPEISVRDGERATLSDSHSESIVVAHRPENGKQTPIVREVVQGTTLRVTVIGIDEEFAVVDAELTLQGKAVKISEETPSPATDPAARTCHAASMARVVDRLPYGKATIYRVDDSLRFELMIERTPTPDAKPKGKSKPT